MQSVYGDEPTTSLVLFTLVHFVLKRIRELYVLHGNGFRLIRKSLTFHQHDTTIVGALKQLFWIMGLRVEKSQNATLHVTK